jgi:hypothetical protein
MVDTGQLIVQVTAVRKTQTRLFRKEFVLSAASLYDA